MTLQEIVTWAQEQMQREGVPESRLNVEYLLEDMVGITRNQYLFGRSEMISEEKAAGFIEAVRRRCRRVPLQYITGRAEFMGLSFIVNENVLIPRQDTECLVEEVLPRAAGKSILDLCTGSGCIGISLAVLAKNCTVTAADLSMEALKTARENARQNHVSIRLIQGNLFENITGQFDLIVSNPPYIESQAIETLMPEVRDYEPILALDGKEDGLYFYREIIRQAPGYLKKGGWLAFEIGCDQYASVYHFMRRQGFEQIYGKKDLAGLDRVILGCLR